jgi:hypothetical protein
VGAECRGCGSGDDELGRGDRATGRVERRRPRRGPDDRVGIDASAAVFAQLGEAAGAKKYADALERWDEIPDESLYKARGRARADEARALFVAERLADAEKARAAGRCADVRDAAADVERLDPRNQLPKQLVRLCRAKPEPVVRPMRARTVAAATTVARPERQPEKPV